MAVGSCQLTTVPVAHAEVVQTGGDALGFVAVAGAR